MVDNGKVLRREKTERKAILTEAETRNIKSGKMSSKSKSKLYSKLDKRLSALVEDLYLLAENEITLGTWRQLKKYEYNSDFSKLAKIFEDLAGSDYTKIYLDKIHSAKNSEGKKTYWLEKASKGPILNKLWKKKRPYYTERIFHVEYIFRGLNDSRKTKELLKKAYHLQLIPFKKQNAITIKTIQKKIESAKRKTIKKMPRCKTCGYRYSLKCPDCKKRFHNKFQKKLKFMRPNEYVQFQSVKTDSF